MKRKYKTLRVEKEYARTISAMNRTGILTLLPRSEELGVIGIDGKEYPVPTQEKLQEVFARNRELVDRKMRQGFTQLQLTPIAMPTSQLIDRVKTAVLTHWSVGLIEPIPIMPQQGQGKIIGGRKQLEEYSTPRDYLRILSTPTYQGETGWTPEDFLTHFITQLETTNQVSHDRHDRNALWLLGSYMPNSMPKAKLVPVGYWDRDAGRRIRLSAHRTGNRLRTWVARSTVRLGT